MISYRYTNVAAGLLDTASSGDYVSTALSSGHTSRQLAVLQLLSKHSAALVEQACLRTSAAVAVVAAAAMQRQACR